MFRAGAYNAAICGLFIKRVSSLIFFAEKQEKSGIFFFSFKKLLYICIINAKNS